MSAIWVSTIIWPALLAFAVAHLTQQRPRLLALFALIVSPVVIWTLGLAIMPAAPASYVEWWIAGMSMIAPIVAVWIVVSLLGFALGRWLVIR